MITLEACAEYFQNGLNSALNNPEIQFSIWADAGKYEKAIRSGNSIFGQIHALLSVSTSANDANNIIALGVNGLLLTVLVPLYTPRTNAVQTEADLQPTNGSNYVFLKQIRAVLDNYFSKAQSFTMEDSQGVEYSVSYKAGIAATGAAELRPGIGNSTELSVYIEVTFAEGGISSKDIKLSIDGNPLPFINLRLGRAPVLECDVFSGQSKTTGFESSTAFTIDADFPATKTGAALTASEYIIDGEPNTVHFVSLTAGDNTKNYFMAWGNAQQSARGITIAGVSASLFELSENPSLYNIPKSFVLTRFRYSTSLNPDGAPIILSFDLNPLTAKYLFVSGIGVVQAVEGRQTFTLNETSFEWNEEEGVYYVSLITDAPIQITNASAEIAAEIKTVSADLVARQLNLTVIKKVNVFTYEGLANKTKTSVSFRGRTYTEDTENEDYKITINLSTNDTLSAATVTVSLTIYKTLGSVIADRTANINTTFYAPL